MKRKRGFSLTGLAAIVLVVALLTATGPTGAQSGAPTVVSYQGQVTVGGAPYDGTGHFKFAVVNAAGDTTYWSNDGTASGEPVNAVALTVSNGLFNVLLGDTALANMTALPATAFDGTERYLRVWFMEDGGSAFTQLSPDRRIAAVPYALQAEEAKNAWRLTGNAGTISTTHFIGTTDAQPLVLRTANTEQARLDAAGNLGLGTDSPAERLTVRGNVQVLSENVPVARGVTSTNLNRPQSVFVTGHYAYVVSYYNSSLSVFDVTNPDSPAALGSTSTNLWSPQSVYVAGRYAYVTSPGNHRLAVFDVSDPNNLVALGFTSTYLDMPWSVVVSGRYAYVTSFSFSDPRLVIFDVSDPNNLVALDWDGTSLQRPMGVAVAGNYAYVTSLDNACLAVFDVSDPTNIVSQGCFTHPGLTGPVAVTIAGRYAYVAGAWSDSLVVFDISDPSNLVALGSISTNLDWPLAVAVTGRYAFVASQDNDSLAVFDVSDPDNLGALGFTSANLDNATAVAVAGRYAYVTGYVNSVLAVFDLNHLESPTADIGNLYASNLHVGENAFVDEHLDVLGSLDVGQNVMVNGDLSVQGDLFAHASVTTLTGSATLVTTQSGVVLVNNAAAATVTLPAAASSTGLTFTIKRLTANAVTVASAGGTIDGAATQALAAQYDFITVVSDGTNWYIVAR